MDTVYNIGTIVYVPISDLPAGVTLLPCKFTYKCKFDERGFVIKYKARVVARGDLQNEC